MIQYAVHWQTGKNSACAGFCKVTNTQGRVTIPCLRQKMVKSISRSRQNPQKTIPYRAARPREGHIRENPPGLKHCERLLRTQRQHLTATRKRQ